MSPPATSIVATISCPATGPARCRDFWLTVLLGGNRSQVLLRSPCQDAARPELVTITVRVFTDSHQRMLHCRPLKAMTANICMAVILITHKPVRTMGC